MLYAYLFSAIVGGVLLGGSLFAGDGHGDHGGGEGGGEGETGGHDHDHGHGHEGVSAAGILFSVRTWTYFLAFGGITGLLLHLLAHSGEPLTALLAAGVGATTGVGARLAFARATALGDSGTVRPEQLVGRTGQLLLPCGSGQTGQVRLTVRNSTVDLLARAAEPGELGSHEEVLIVGMKDGEALVVRNPTSAAESSDEEGSK